MCPFENLINKNAMREREFLTYMVILRSYWTIVFSAWRSPPRISMTIQRCLGLSLKCFPFLKLT
jgi:predicted ATPase